MKKLILLAAFLFGLSVSGQNPTPFDYSIKAKYVATEPGATPDIAVFDSNKVLKKIAWATLPSALPSQAGHADEYLTTNGTSSSWAPLPEWDLQSVLLAGGTAIDGANEWFVDMPTATFSWGTAKTGFNISDGSELLLLKQSATDYGQLSIQEDNGTILLSSAKWLSGDVSNIAIDDNGAYMETASGLNATTINTSATSISMQAAYGSDNSFIYIGNGEIILSEQKGAFGPFTQVEIENPTEETYWRIPAEGVAGNYYFASKEYVDSAVSAVSGDLSDYVPFTGGIMTGDLQVETIPATANSAASRNFVENLFMGTGWKKQVKCATTANHSLSGTSNIDGVTAPAGTRVLVMFQTAPEQNGIYITAAGAWSRATDADTEDDLETATVSVTSGTVYGKTIWNQYLTITTIDVSGVGFTNIPTAGALTADGTYISLISNVLSINTTNTATVATAQTFINKNISGSTNTISNIAQSSVTSLVTDLASKQATLVSGTNIKTVESNSLLGSGNIDLSKSDVGLSNVDNTSDLAKPISTLTQTALDANFQKSILKTNHFWFTPSSLSPSGSFGYSTNANQHSFTLAGNASGSKGMVLFASTTTAGTIASLRRHDGFQFQGFTCKVTRKIQFQTNISGQRFFNGFTKNNQFSAPTNVDQTTLVDIVGVAQLSTSTNMHVIHNDASGTATTIDLGSSYPCNDPQYNYYITTEQTTTTYIVSVERVTVATGASISTSNTLSTNIPVYNTGTIQMCTWITNNATAAVASYLDGGGEGNFDN